MTRVIGCVQFVKETEKEKGRGGRTKVGGKVISSRTTLGHGCVWGGGAAGAGRRCAVFVSDLLVK